MGTDNQPNSSSCSVKGSDGMEESIPWEVAESSTNI